MIKKLWCIVLFMNIHADQWQNWAKNQQCTTKIVTPNSVQELIDVVKKAGKENKTVRAYGTGHSWSDIVCTDGYLINTDKLNKIISIDREKKQVTVQAGIKLKDLNEYLAKIGLSLSNQGAITQQSLAGVTGTATHGSGKTGTLANFITKVQLLTADGTLKTISTTENAELFGAARTNMGSLGIMTELTVQCEPLFKLHKEEKTITWSEMLETYQQLLETNDFMQCSWDASDETVSVLIHNRTKNNAHEKKSLIKKINPFNREDYSYKMLSGSLWVIYMEEEIAVPVTKFTQAAQAARALVQKSYQKNAMFSGILFRFVRAEKNNFLSPAADRDVVFFSITTPSRTGYEPFYKEFYDLMLKYDGRPHWGKINYLTQSDAKKLYGKNFDKFVEIRKTLDPQGMFSNSFTKRIFGW